MVDHNKFLKLSSDHYFHKNTGLHIVHEGIDTWNLYDDMNEKSISPRHESLAIAIKCVETIEEHPALLKALHKFRS